MSYHDDIGRKKPNIGIQCKLPYYDGISDYHDDIAKKKKPRKRGVVPIDKRFIVSDCQPGDVIEFFGGRLAIVTAYLNGAIMGRWLDKDGKEGELTVFGDDRPITRLRGFR